MLQLSCFSGHNYCPATITCEAEGEGTMCHANPALGSTWALLDAEFLPAAMRAHFRGGKLAILAMMVAGVTMKHTA
jgi:hypothetical protein